MRTNTTASRSDVLAGWVKAIGRTLEAAGCDSVALLAEAGLDRECMESATARCPLANTARLWEISVAATGDPAARVFVRQQFHTGFSPLDRAVALGLARRRGDASGCAVRTSFSST